MVGHARFEDPGRRRLGRRRILAQEADEVERPPQATFARPTVAGVTVPPPPISVVTPTAPCRIAAAMPVRSSRVEVTRPKGAPIARMMATARSSFAGSSTCRVRTVGTYISELPPE
jgi:hypothetical protein